MKRNIFLIALSLIVGIAPAQDNANLIATKEKRRLIPGRTAETFYHHQLKKIVLINGCFDPDPWHTKYIELWQWNNNEWELISDSGPETRNSFAWAYDNIRGTLIIYGGTVSQAANNRKWYSDTWEWSGKTWTQIITPVDPGLRGLTKMIYDPAQKTCILFGGLNEKFELLGDTWAYNENEWKQIFTNGPSARFPAAMFYFPITKKTYLYGGHAKISLTERGLTGDTWELNTTGWKEIESLGIAGKQEGAVVVFNERAKKIWMVGGSGNTPEPKFLGSTWAFDGHTWSITDIKGLPSRGGHGLTYDPFRESIMVQGGFNIGGGPSLKDTWILEPDKKEWKCISGCIEEQEQWIVDHTDDGNALLTFVATAYYMGKPDKVKDLISKAVRAGQMPGNSYRRIGTYLMAAKMYKEGIMCYEKALAMEPNGGDFYNLACGYLKLNDKDNAFKNLNKAIELGFNSKQQYENDTDLASLKSDSRWKVLLEKLK